MTKIRPLLLIILLYLAPAIFALPNLHRAHEFFGPNTYVFSADSHPDSIHAIVERIHTHMFREQFGSDRFAILFLPGDYRQAGLLKVPYYVHMAGLGKTPYDVIVSNIHTPAPLSNDNGTCTFWRSLENLSVVGPETYDHDETFAWAVSQAAPLRRVHSTRTVRNQWHNGWVSGGFTADCHFQAPAGSDGQQQWYTRNSYLAKGRGEFQEGAWNFMFQGVELGPDADRDTYRNNWAEGGNVTFVDSTDVIREKPFIFVGDDARYKIFRPALRRNAIGISYTHDDMGPGDIFDLEDEFFIVAPGTDASTINEQLLAGKHILFLPGIHLLDEPIHITHPGTIAMGIGWATLAPSEQNSQAALVVDDVDGVTIASLLFDTYYNSRYLLHVRGSQASHKDCPTLLSDVFFRVGGVLPKPVNVDCALRIDANDLIGDHFWIWRADHGLPNSVGWDVNTADCGLHVTGHNVTIYGLFNEHFQKYQTYWEGEAGRVYFYQCETPYDAGRQDRYMSENGTRPGYAAYKVADNVTDHHAWALGIYDVYFRTDIRMENSVEAPIRPGVRFTHLCNVSLSEPGNRGIGYIINGTYPSTYRTYRVNRPYIVSYPPLL